MKRWPTLLEIIDYYFEFFACALILCMVIALLFGCAQPPTQIVKPEVVQDRMVTEPKPLCRLAGPPALVSILQRSGRRAGVDAYRAALRQSNADKSALRSLQPTEDSH